MASPVNIRAPRKHTAMSRRCLRSKWQKSRRPMLCPSPIGQLGKGVVICSWGDMERPIGCAGTSSLIARPSKKRYSCTDVEYRAEETIYPIRKQLRCRGGNFDDIPLLDRNIQLFSTFDLLEVGREEDFAAIPTVSGHPHGVGISRKKWPTSGRHGP